MPVDASGTFEGRDFSNIQAFKILLAQQERQIARNILERLVIHSTGAIPTFSDRTVIEDILDKNASTGYGLRTLVLDLLETPVFLQK